MTETTTTTDSAHTIVIDTDPGIDDAVAIALATHSPELRVALITTVAGNVAVTTATANALALTRRLGRDDIPVAAGAAQGLVYPKPPHRAIHGLDGLGGSAPPPADRAADPRPAVRALAQLLAAEPAGSVTLVAIAPLTNLALLLAAEPELARRLARVVIMGGSGAAGNVTPAAEYNVWADPEAAARVLAGGEIAVSLVPLDITRGATLGPGATRGLRHGSRLGADLAQMIDGYGAADPDDSPLHDVVALAAVIDPTLLQSTAASVRVHTDFGPRRGATEILDPPEPRRTAPEGAAPTLQVATRLDLARWRELVLGRLAGD